VPVLKVRGPTETDLGEVEEDYIAVILREGFDEGLVADKSDPNARDEDEWLFALRPAMSEANIEKGWNDE